MDTLQEGLAAAKAGDRARSRALLMDHVEQYPDDETGWLWLAAVVDTPEEALACLERALFINPQSRRAQAGLNWARAQRATATPPAPTTPTPPSEPAPPPESTLPSGPTPSGLLRRLTSSAPPPVILRHSSPYAPTRRFTEADLATLPEVTARPLEEPEKAAPPESDRSKAWDALPVEEPAAPAGEPAPEPPGAAVEEFLGPPPSLADRLGTWGAPPEEPAVSAGEPAPEPPGVAVEEFLGPPPSLADRLGTWGTPSASAAPSPPTERSTEPGAPLESVLSLSGRLSQVETSLATSAPPSPATSLSERLRQLRGEPPAPVETDASAETVEELMARGEEALESHQLAEAERSFRQVLKLDPGHPQAHANLAMVHYINDRRTEAIAELKIAAQRQPDYEDALYTLGVILNEVGRTGEAIEAWRQVLRINPAHAEAQHELEKATIAVTSAEEAAGEGIRCPNCDGVILTTVSTCPHCDYELFTVCPRCKEYVPADSRHCPGCGYTLDAGQSSDTGEKSPRQEAEARTRLGLAYLEGGQVADSLREWQEAIAIDPTCAAPHFYMGLLFVEQRQAARAIDAFQQALRLDPDYADAYLELGLIYLAQSKRQWARRAFEECLKHQPRDEIRQEAQAHLAGLR